MYSKSETNELKNIISSGITGRELTDRMELFCKTTNRSHFGVNNKFYSLKKSMGIKKETPSNAPKVRIATNQVSMSFKSFEVDIDNKKLVFHL